MKNLVKEYENGRYNDDYSPKNQKFSKSKPNWK